MIKELEVKDGANVVPSADVVGSNYVWRLIYDGVFDVPRNLPTGLVTEVGNFIFSDRTLRRYRNRILMFVYRLGNVGIRYSETFRIPNGANDTVDPSDNVARLVSAVSFTGEYLRSIGFQVNASDRETDRLAIGNSRTLLGRFTTEGIRWDATQPLNIRIEQVYLLDSL